MNAVTPILNLFEPIALSDMEPVALMARVDTKFTFSAAQLPVFLEKMAPHYQLLHVRNAAVCTYKNVYFDTPARDMYLKHHNGRLNRYKVRYRRYAESNTGFLEVKFKNNKGRTLKQRMRMHEEPLYWDAASLQFLNTHTPYDPLLLHHALDIDYQRMTLVGKTTHERVTVDMNLSFSLGAIHHKLDTCIIVEVKQLSKRSTPAITILKELNIKEAALSKYCLGIMQVYPRAKKNNFKQQLTALNKLVYDTSFSVAAGGR